MNIVALPLEIQLDIFSRLNERDLASLASTCTTFKHLSTDPHLNFPRILPSLFKNLQERKYHYTSVLHDTLIHKDHVFWVKDSDAVLLKITNKTQLDKRTKVNYDSKLEKIIMIDEMRVELSFTTLQVNKKPIEKGVLDFACLNGIIIYTTPSGLFRYSIALDKSERISKNHYDMIAVDEEKGIIYGLSKDKFDTLDFCHPDAISRLEDSSQYLIKRKIIDVVATFFKEIKNFLMNNFKWKEVGLIAGGAIFIALLLTSAIATTFLEVLPFLAVFLIFEAFCLAVLVTLETLKHAFTKAFDVAIKPL